MEKYPKLIVTSSEESFAELLAAESEAEGRALYSLVLEDATKASRYSAVLIPEQDQSSLKSMNSFFRLHYLENGVFFELLPRFGSGKAMDEKAVLVYLDRKKIDGYRKEEAQEVMGFGYGYVLIGSRQTEKICDEDIHVTVSANEMKAYITILEADPGGDRLTAAKAMELLHKAGVVSGIAEELVLSAAESGHRNESILVAEGMLPIQGKNGALEFHFEREHSGKPQLIDEEDRVDYKDLDLYTSVKAGDRLVTRIPAVPGKPGYTVKGKELRAGNVTEAKMPSGKNVKLDPDKLQMSAQVSGRVDFTNGQVIVSNIFEIKEDADFSVGNLDFDGDIVIRGGVISDLTLKATGNIEVYGTVQVSRLIAGGDILLHRGMSGGDKGLLQADGNVTAVYIERCKVKAGKNVYSNTVIHSDIECGLSVEIKGKQGSIVGGVVRAGQYITAQNIGSVANTRTVIEVGVAPGLRNQLAELEKENEQIIEEQEKYEKIIRYLGQVGDLPDDRQKMLRASIVGQARNNQRLAELKNQIEQLKLSIEYAIHGKVEVSDTVYAGVKIIIASAVYNVGQQMKYATFRWIDGEVGLAPK